MGGHVCDVAAMVVVQMAFAGINVFYKLAINDGMDMRIMIAYRFLFATAFLIPLAFFLERKSRPKFTWKIMIQTFFCGLFGASLAQNFYVASMKATSATFSSAMTNLIPAITFILAVLFRLEKLGIQTVPGQAKVLGTVVGISGAMLLTFFKGSVVNLWPTTLQLVKPHQTGNTHRANELHSESGNSALGALLAVASCFCYSIWLIIQAKMAKSYPCHYTSTTLMCLMASIQSVIFALCSQRDWAQWRMGFGIRLLTAFYAGIVASGITLTVLTWCIRRKGPLYTAVFNPLMLVIVALLGSLLLNEELHLGSILGAVLIVIGLYIVLWGKSREAANVGEKPVDELIDVVVVPVTISSQEVVLGTSDDTSESKHTKISSV